MDDPRDWAKTNNPDDNLLFVRSAVFGGKITDDVSTLDNNIVKASDAE
jgi:hypothetical protein